MYELSKMKIIPVIIFEFAGSRSRVASRDLQ